MSLLSPEVRSRLEALQRGPLPSTVPDTVRTGGLLVELDPRLTEGCEVATPWGDHWWIERSLEQIWPDAGCWIDQARATTEIGSNHGPTQLPSELSLLQHAFPQGIVLLDLETCGLAGSMIFLAGLLYEEQGQLHVTQLWARDYSEEKPLLQSMWNIVRQKDLLITFNGKSFDWPQVHDRSTLHHLGYRRDANGSTVAPRTSSIDRLTCDQQRPEPAHLDLLHHARRRWRRQLPNCRLQTLERYICGRQRTGDIPGRDIPAAYHDYVREGNPHVVKSILHHNALDLVTLLQLALTFLSEGTSAPETRNASEGVRSNLPSSSGFPPAKGSGESR